jgi:hypothetical protein
MAITLEDTARQSYPVLRHQLIGEMAQLALIRWEQRDRLMLDHDNQYVRIPNGIGRDGQPKFKQELVIHAIAMPGTNMEVKKGEEFICPAPGERVRLILKGQAFGNWIEARKKHRNNTLQVGDLIMTGTTIAQCYDEAGKPKGPEIRDQQEALKVPRSTTLGFYGPLELAEPTDPRWVDAAEQAYLADKRAEQEAKAITLAEPAPAGGGWGDYVSSEEIPY